MIDLKILNGKSKSVIFDNYFLNFDFLITLPCSDIKFCVLSLHTHLEGSMSQIFYLGLSFCFMTKIGKHFINFANIIFQVT